MAEAAHAPELKSAFDHHLEETKSHANRLEEVLELAGEDIRGGHCKGVEALIDEGLDCMEEMEDPEMLDAALIAAAQRVEHYEIAAYGCVRTYAELLDETGAMELLELTLQEESAADELLTEISLNIIRLSGEEEEEEEEELEEY